MSPSLIEYRAIAPIGQGRLTTGFVHDPKTQETMLSDLGFFDRLGIVLIARDADRQFSRRETDRIAFSQRINCAYIRGEKQLADISILPLDETISVLEFLGDKGIRGVVFLSGTQNSIRAGCKDTRDSP